MDSKKESNSMRNIQEQEIINLDCSSSKSTLKHQGHGDGDEEVCAPMSNEIESFAIVPSSANLNLVSYNECSEEQHNSLENKDGANEVANKNSDKIPCNATSSQFGKQLAGSSKSASNLNKSPSQCEKSCNQVNNACVIKPNLLCDINEPSTSGLCVASSSKSEPMPSSSETKDNKKRPSTLRLKRPIVDGEDSSSDTGNDDYSLGSEDGCIYTYRGAMPAGPQQQAVPNPRAPGSRVSSPDMDFLEMDFDPGPSCEADTGDESTPEADIEVVSVPEANEHVIRGTSPEYQPGVAQPHSINIPVAPGSSIKTSIFDLPPINSETEAVPENTTVVKKIRRTHTEYITHVNVRGEKLRVRRTMSHWLDTKPPGVHGSSGDLISPKDLTNLNEEQKNDGIVHQINQGENTTTFESVNLTPAMYHVNMAKKLIDDKPNIEEGQSSCSVEEEPIPGPSQSNEPCIEPPRCMVWSEREACEQQVTQIGTSACGATAVVNVFLALGVPVDIERINLAVGTRQRANNAPIPRYLLSRSVAGCTAADIVTGIQKASDGLVTARFFSTYPERSLSLSHWLADWISLGAVPILTLNLQQGCEGEIPDAWHHQMVFGVSPRGVYLCNPVECVPENILWSRLVSPSVLLVRSRDVISRFNAETDMSPLTAVPDVRFHKLNVLGQVANVLREWRHAGCPEAPPRTRHVRVPAAYQPGVTLAALTGSEAHRRLAHAPPPPRHAPRDPA
ncbi:uncharacterized protein LOC119831848 isoform X2 [Zerene cesonia]|uniref:uncharacterized protein LOC119831848 isoform X2 n=1 Tax=Zerene cesonia TaxID=33412 RepID=UPI0018E553A3|nr:uncharacterized protein LOC119831848 isoform X2 [Zerene cesonia]